MNRKLQISVNVQNVDIIIFYGAKFALKFKNQYKIRFE